ncbi:MAG: dienelactone hydrolase family protein [Candidatus Binatia bacterium]
MKLKKIRCVSFTFLVSIYGCSDVISSGDYRLGGWNPDALLCRPEGKGPFPAIVHNHGVGVDINGYQKAVDRGYNLPAICKELAAGGFVTFIPIRRGGPGPLTVTSHKAQVIQAIKHVKSLPDVDPSRVAVSGNSRGALLTLMAGIEQKGLKALVVMALAAVGSNLSETLPRISSLDAPVLLLIEASDTAEHQQIFDELDRLLREDKKEVKSIRYERGGGHNLFHSAGYYLADIKAFLNEKLDGR